MNAPRAFVRIFFVLLSMIFMTTYTTGIAGDVTAGSIVTGLLIGLGFGLLLIAFDLLFRRFNFRAFNIAVVGLFFGYLMGQALVLILDAISNITSLQNDAPVVEIIKIALFLFGTFLGLMMALRAADEFYVSIPFVRFAQVKGRARELLVDSSILADPRLLDFASTGLLDGRLVLPRFVVKELHSQVEDSSEEARSHARQALETLKKLEEMRDLEMRAHDTDFPEAADLPQKLVRLARLVDADILSADLAKIGGGGTEGVRVITLHSLSTALKPMMETGETLKVKVQRTGKEPMQGVGYLDDGAMVVVNGGGDRIGEEVVTRVLSVKHTSAGRIIFCNLVEGRA